jgi:hypothetical protein
MVVLLPPDGSGLFTVHAVLGAAENNPISPGRSVLIHFALSCPLFITNNKQAGN